MISMMIMKNRIYQYVYEVEIDGKTAPYSLKSIKEENGEIYISSSYLEEYGGLKTRIIISDKKIEICRGEASAIFMTGKKKGDAFIKSNRYFIPLKHLLEEFGGKYIWDKENKILAIDFYYLENK